MTPTLADRVRAAYGVLAAEGAASCRPFIGPGKVLCVVERDGVSRRFSMSISRYLDGRWDDEALRRQFRFVAQRCRR